MAKKTKDDDRIELRCLVASAVDLLEECEYEELALEDVEDNYTSPSDRAAWLLANAFGELPSDAESAIVPEDIEYTRGG